MPGYSLLLLVALNIVEVYLCWIEALWGGALHCHGKGNAVQVLQRGCLQQQQSFLKLAGQGCQSAIAMYELETCQTIINSLNMALKSWNFVDGCFIMRKA